MRKIPIKIEKFLREKDGFLLSTHINADGDAIGSVLAFGWLLEKLGKSFEIVLHDKTPDEKYSFLHNFHRITSYREEDLKAQNVVILDTPNMDRVGQIVKLIGDRTDVLNIDHHESNDEFGHLNLVDRRASATTELIYEVICSLGFEFDDKIASQIYTGIMFDTGRFMFANTSKRALSICAKMVEYGARPGFIANRVYGEKSFDSVRTLGKALDSLESHHGGRVSSIFLVKDALDPHCDIEGFVDHIISIKGVEVAFFLREYERDKFKVSLRSKGGINVNKIAQTFGGGGHSKAASCQIKGDLQRVKNLLLKEIEKYLYDFFT